MIGMTVHRIRYWTTDTWFTTRYSRRRGTDARPDSLSPDHAPAAAAANTMSPKTTPSSDSPSVVRQQDD